MDYRQELIELGLWSENDLRDPSLARAEKFDLYLLDNWPPEGPGDVLCGSYASSTRPTPVLFYSGAATGADKAKAMQCGAQGSVIKPAEPEVLISEIRRLL